MITFAEDDFPRPSNGDKYWEFEIEEMVIELLSEHILFLNTRKFVDIALISDPETHKVTGAKDGEIREHTIVVFVNTNDILSLGWADAESIKLKEIPTLWELWKWHPFYGIVKWCCRKNKIQPQTPVADDMKKEGFWDDEMEKLEKNWDTESGQ